MRRVCNIKLKTDSKHTKKSLKTLGSKAQLPLPKKFSKNAKDVFRSKNLNAKRKWEFSYNLEYTETEEKKPH